MDTVTAQSQHSHSTVTAQSTHLVEGTEKVISAELFHHCVPILVLVLMLVAEAYLRDRER